MGCPECEGYYEYMAELDAAAEAEYEETKAFYEYIEALLDEGNYKLMAMEMVAFSYSECLGDKKEFLEKLNSLRENRNIKSKTND